MKRIFYLILISTFCSNCSESVKEWKAEREATIDVGAEPKNESFEVTFQKMGDTLNYHYVSKIDSSKTINIKKVENSSFLFFAFEKFVKIDKEPFINKKIKGFEFEYYVMEYPEVDGTGPILFNSKYGLLAINNVYGPTIIFLEKKDNTLVEEIIDKLNE